MTRISEAGITMLNTCQYQATSLLLWHAMRRNVSSLQQTEKSSALQTEQMLFESDQRVFI